jgi:hypothetical protein
MRLTIHQKQKRLNEKYIKDHKKEIIEKYIKISDPHHWILVYKQNVVTAKKTMSEILQFSKSKMEIGSELEYIIVELK